MSLLDRGRSLLAGALGVAETLAPEWGLKREIARGRADMIRAQGYSEHGASRTKKSMQGWITARGGPDADVTLNLDLLRQRSRDLCMGEPLAIGALKTIRANEVGAGLRLNAQIDADYLGMNDEQALEWEQHTEREFALWAESRACDAARRCTFGELQALARLSQLMSGDVFALLPAVERPGDRYDLRVQLLEADRVSDPWPYPIGRNVLGGVEIGEYGEPIAYHVARRHPGDMIVPTLYGAFSFGASGGYNVGPLPPIADVGPFGAMWNTWDRLPAFGPSGRQLVLHLMDSERPGQRRGVPILAPVMERLKQLSRYSDAELMAAVVSGFFTAAITSELPQSMLGQVLPSGQLVPDAPGDTSSYQLGNGALLGLAPGEKMESVNPARPNAGFDPFVKAVCRQIGAGLGLPYELVVMQFEASYSASRAALLEAWKRFTVGRKAIESNFCQPVYEQWLEEAIARGYIEAPHFFADPLTRAAWCGAEWHGPAQGQLDPTKEVEAAEKRVEGGFSTRTRETAELTGGNWERNHRVRVREEKLRRDGGVVVLPANIYPPPGAAATTDTGETQADPAKKEAI